MSLSFNGIMSVINKKLLVIEKIIYPVHIFVNSRPQENALKASSYLISGFVFIRDASGDSNCINIDKVIKTARNRAFALCVGGLRSKRVKSNTGIIHKHHMGAPTSPVCRQAGIYPTVTATHPKYVRDGGSRMQSNIKNPARHGGRIKWAISENTILRRWC